MKFTKHSYIYAFERAERLYDKVYYEVELEEGDTIEDAENVVMERCKQRAKEVCESMNKYLNGSLLDTSPSYPISSDWEKLQGTFTIQHKQSEPEERRIGDIVSDIKSCTDKRILETYRILAKTKPEFQTAYDEQMELLTSKEEEEAK